MRSNRSVRTVPISSVRSARTSYLVRQVGTHLAYLVDRRAHPRSAGPCSQRAKLRSGHRGSRRSCAGPPWPRCEPQRSDRGSPLDLGDQVPVSCAPPRSGCGSPWSPCARPRSARDSPCARPRSGRGSPWSPCARPQSARDSHWPSPQSARDSLWPSPQSARDSHWPSPQSARDSCWPLLNQVAILAGCCRNQVPILSAGLLDQVAGLRPKGRDLPRRAAAAMASGIPVGSISRIHSNIGLPFSLGVPLVVSSSNIVPRSIVAQESRLGIIPGPPGRSPTGLAHPRPRRAAARWPPPPRTEVPPSPPRGPRSAAAPSPPCPPP